MQKAIYIIKRYLASESQDCDINESELSSLFPFASAHDIAHLIGAAIQDQKIARTDAYAPYFESQIQALARYEIQNYELLRIYEQLENAEIDYLPLKGSVIRQLYPEPWHRTSCDIDVLVPLKDLDCAVSVLVGKLGYTVLGKSEHDVSIRTPSNVHVELHFELHEHNITAAEVWESAAPASPESHRYSMTTEMFILCHIAHMAKHFKRGGCGLRPFIDLKLIMQKMPHNDDVLLSLLSQKGLEKFAEATFALTDLWFGEGRPAPELSAIAEYILNAGAYGSVSNKVAFGMAQNRGRIRYFFKRAFIPIDILKYKYPVLEKHPFLYIFCNAHRWYRLIFRGKYRAVKNELTANIKLDLEYSDKIKRLMEYLEI